MEAKLVRRGNGLAIELPVDEVERLGLREGQTVEVTPKVDPPSIRPTPTRRSVNGHPVYTLAEMIAEMERLGPSHRPEIVEWGPDVGAEIIRDDY